MGMGPQGAWGDRLGRCPVLAAVMFTTACAMEGPDVTEATPERADSAGTEIVTNRPVPGDAPPRWTVGSAPRVVIGETPGAEPEYQFAHVASALTLSDGRIVVLDGGAAEVRWYSPDGDYLYGAGGRGQGPGEFTAARAVYAGPGDTLIVEDARSGKHVFFSPEGEVVREDFPDARTPAALPRFVECASQMLPDRSLLTCVPEAGEPPPNPYPDPGRLRDMRRLVRVSRDRSTVDTLGLWGGVEQFGIVANGRTQFAMHPHYSRTHLAASRGPLRIAIALNPEYSIEIWTPDGRLERIVRREDARRAPTDEERRTAREALAIFAGGDDALANRFMAEVPEPSAIPAVQGLAFSTSGNLFVARTPWSERSATMGEWDIFDATGRWTGTVELPARFRPTEVGPDYLLGVMTDDLDIQSVQLLDLERPGGAR